MARKFTFSTDFNTNTTGSYDILDNTPGVTGERNSRLVTYYRKPSNVLLRVNNDVDPVTERIDSFDVRFDFGFTGGIGQDEVGNGLADGISFNFGTHEYAGKYELGLKEGLSITMLPFDGSEHGSALSILWNGQVIATHPYDDYSPETQKNNKTYISVNRRGEVTVEWGYTTISGEIPGNEWKTANQDYWNFFLGARTGVNMGEGWVDNLRVDALVTVPCFTAGTLIETREGSKPVEALSAGDMVITADDGYQPIHWIGSIHRDAVDLAYNPKLKPVCIPAGALGAGLPKLDLMVSRQHRVLVRSNIAKQIFGAKEVLVPAIKLVGYNGIEIATEIEDVTYFHILFDKHQVVLSNGTPTESLYTGPFALKSLSAESLKEIETLFPEITAPGFTPIPARQLSKNGAQIRKMISRHVKNGVPLIGS